MKNRLFWALLIGVSVLFAIIVWAAITSLPGYGIADPLAAVCTAAFLVVAFVAWEVFMKPGYGYLARRRGERDEEAEEPPSPRAP